MVIPRLSLEAFRPAAVLCVLGSLNRLMPTHSTKDRLLALDLAADLLRNGRGSSVQKFRQANIDEAAVDRMMRHAEAIASDPSCILDTLASFSDLETAAISHWRAFPWIWTSGVSNCTGRCGHSVVPGPGKRTG